MLSEEDDEREDEESVMGRTQAEHNTTRTTYLRKKNVQNKLGRTGLTVLCFDKSEMLLVVIV